MMGCAGFFKDHDEPILQHLTDIKVQFQQADPMVWLSKFVTFILKRF